MIKIITRSIALVCIAVNPPFLFAEDSEAQQPKESTRAPSKVRVISEQTKSTLLKSMVWVEGGSFEMGSDAEGARLREQPKHTVTVDSFYMAKTEVTQALWLEVMGWDNSYYPCDNCPVNNISWLNMQLFIERLNAATGETFRFPTEAEWAYAAKGGKQSKGTAYSGSDHIDEVAWYAGNANRRSHQVAQKKPNELGLYDMTGNLWEFCLDDMNKNAYTREPRTNPLFLQKSSEGRVTLKVMRGGGYEFAANESEIYKRDGATSNVRLPDLGFRLAMTKKLADNEK